MDARAWQTVLVVAVVALSVAIVLSRAITPIYRKMTARAWRQVWSYIVALIFVILLCLLTELMN